MKGKIVLDRRLLLSWFRLRKFQEKVVNYLII